MNRQWSEFKKHFVVESLPIVGNLENVIDWYFDVLPPFSEKKWVIKKSSFATLAQLVEQLIRNQ